MIAEFHLTCTDNFILTRRRRAVCSVTGPSTRGRSTTVATSIGRWWRVALSGAGSGATTTTCRIAAAPWSPCSPDAINCQSKKPDWNCSSCIFKVMLYVLVAIYTYRVYILFCLYILFYRLDKLVRKILFLPGGGGQTAVLQDPVPEEDPLQ